MYQYLQKTALSHLHLRLHLRHPCLVARQLGIVSDLMAQLGGEPRPMLEQPSIGFSKLCPSQVASVIHRARLIHLHRDVLSNTILLQQLRVDERS